MVKQAPWSNGGPVEIRIDLSAVAIPDKESNTWIAHCLEMDVVAEGATASEALSTLKELCDLQINACIDSGDIDGIFRPAPTEIWGLYARAKDSGQRINDSPGHANRFSAREYAVA